MTIPKIVGAQRDFSAGELDVAMKRADESPMMKAGARQMSNWRILNSRVVQNRPGRRPLFLETGRVDEVNLSPGNVFLIAFTADGHLRIYSLAGTKLFEQAGFPWTAATIQNVVWDSLRLQIFITFPGMQPQVLSWDGVSVWSVAAFAEAIVASGQKRTPFYRISPQNVTMLPSAITGFITLTFSSPIVVAAMRGTRMRYCNRQLLLGTMISTTEIYATVIEQLPPAQTLTLTGAVGNFALGDVVRGTSSGAEGIVAGSVSAQYLAVLGAGPFNIGDAVSGATSGATGTITSVGTNGAITDLAVSLSTTTPFQAAETINDTTSGGSGSINSVSGNSMTVQLIPSDNSLRFFSTSDDVVGPSAFAGITAVASTNPQAVSVWDDEVMNSFRGYPSSVFVDQFRLGFCNFPSVPGGIGWSAIDSPTDLYVDGTPDNALFEIAPTKSQVYFVVPGPESGEFVFCDNRIFYIPISVADPLKSGSVAFNLLSSDGSAQVQPRPTEELIFYVSAGGLRVKTVIAPGAYFRPFNTVDVSENHVHLFSNIIALATPTADSTFPERYCYALNAGGAVVVGKYQSRQGIIEGVVGWLPWSGAGTVAWVSATVGADVIFSSTYFGASMIEVLDATQYLDCALAVNNPPAPLIPPAGGGPLWFIPNQTVSLIDLGTRIMGTYQIDATGHIIPQNIDGENLASAQLVAGQPWTATLEPFVPDAPPGQSVHQRMFRRRVSRMAVYVSSSTGFLLARLFSGPLTPTSPALGTIMNTRRVPAWNQGDDPTKAPPLREEAERWRPLGRSYDPRVALIKDTPGPLIVHEFGLEASI